MSDPAIEAAQRVWDARYPGMGFTPSNNAVAAVREALKPLRELHKRSGLYSLVVDECSGCSEFWPCVTAELIYSSEELARGE